VHALAVEALLVRKLKQRTYDIGAQLGGARLTGDSESVSTAGDFDLQAAFDLSQVLVELSAQIGQTVVVGGFQDDVPGYFYSVQWRLFDLSFVYPPHGDQIVDCKTTSMVYDME
jgi:hypothetical protein